MQDNEMMFALSKKVRPFVVIFIYLWNWGQNVETFFSYAKTLSYKKKKFLLELKIDIFRIINWFI